MRASAIPCWLLAGTLLATAPAVTAARQTDRAGAADARGANATSTDVVDATTAPAAGDGLRVSVEVEPREATVGDRLAVRFIVTVPPQTRLDPPSIGPALGPFTVTDGAWEEPETLERGGVRRVWKGFVVAYRTGEMELPALRIVVRGDDGSTAEARTDPVTVTIASVLDRNGSEGEIADLKPPASLPADYGALVTAAGILALLLLGAALVWWLHRRYAARLAAVPAPEDPFHRIPPHEWVYAELQKLLERRLAEQGQVDVFFAELSRIVKVYLGGRYRVELLERTSAEVPDDLTQAGAPADAIEAVRALLERCDRVKFAREAPGSDECRAAIDAAYGIVDATRPKVEAAEAVQGAA